MNVNTGREKFQKFKLIINFTSSILRLFGKRINLILLKFFRNTNGPIGLVLRYIFLKNCAQKVGDNVSIHPCVFLFNLNHVVIGDNVSIHPLCYLDGFGGLEIGSNVSIAHNCSILTTNHQWSDLNLPIKYNKEVTGKVVIKDDVWLGCGVRILAGVNINSRSILAAGAVVTKDVESNSIYAGVPAKKIKDI